MKAFWIVLAWIILTGCSFTIAPIPKPTVNRPHSAQTYKPHHATSKTVLVDSTWIENYRGEEKEHSYTIPDDAKIKAVGNKFSVPQSVVEHFNDLTRTPSP